MSMRSSSEPMAVDASRGARRAASAASSRPSSAEAEGTRRAPLREVLSSFAKCTSGVPATRGARLGRPVGSPRRARRTFTGPRHAIRAGGSRCACVAMVRRARAFPVWPRSLTHALKPFRSQTPGKQHPRQKTPAKRRGRVGKSAVVGAVTRGCRGMTAMVSSMTRRHLDRPRVSVVRVHGMTITRAPTRRPRTKIYHAGNREIPKQILERHLSSRGWKIGSNREWCVNGVCGLAVDGNWTVSD